MDRLHVMPEPGMLDDDHWSSFSADFGDYDLNGTIGFGASSTVYAAIHQTGKSASPVDAPSPSSSSSGSNPRKPSLTITIPAPNPHSSSSHGKGKGKEKECAIKISSLNADVNQLFRESRLLGLSRHPNVLRVLATFTLPPDHQRIAIVTPLIAGGSLAGILDWRTRMSAKPKRRGRLPKLGLGRSKDSDDENDELGILDEEEIKAVTKQVLDGLTYLHGNGFLHRDLKAGNVLVAQDGTILLADFGVGGDINAALTPVEANRPMPVLEDVKFADTNGTPVKYARELAPRMNLAEDVGKRKSFVGTPSWIAPEIIMGQKYDAKADIWSLGITLLELAHGAAPRSAEKPNNILKHTVLDAAPTLNRSTGHFSKAMKDFVNICLVKDPDQRPTSADLLEHPWLKNAKKKAFLAESLLGELPALETRQELRRVPTMSSLASRASSWDFSATPSLPSSPIRPSMSGLSVKNTPNISQLEELPSFPSMTSRTHSRTSSRLPSLPPSPRVSLRQWAETTVGEYNDADSYPRRSTSENPNLPSARNSRLMRGHNVSFDGSLRQSTHPSPRGPTRRPPSSDGSVGPPMSPLIESWTTQNVPSDMAAGSAAGKIESLLLRNPHKGSDSLQRTTSPETMILNKSTDTDRTAFNAEPVSSRSPSPTMVSRSNTVKLSPPSFKLNAITSNIGGSAAQGESTEANFDMRRGRSGTLISPDSDVPGQEGELAWTQSQSVSNKDKKGLFGRKVGVASGNKKEGEKEGGKWGGGLGRRLTGKKKDK